MREATPTGCSPAGTCRVYWADGPAGRRSPEGSTDIDRQPLGDRPAGRGLPFNGAFESTYLPGHGVDVAELSGRDQLWRVDLDSVLSAGVRTVRYPLHWHRIEQC